jgi:hypothetical protein
MPEESINALALSRLLGSPANLVGLELARLVDAGLLERYQESGDRSVYYQRKPSAFWRLVTEFVEERMGAAVDVEESPADRSHEETPIAPTSVEEALSALGSRISPASAPQHLRALARANEIRLARAELKRQVAEGEISVVSVILECPWEAASMTVSDLLTSQRRWGSTRVRKVLQSIPMSENKTIGSMTERHRTALAGLLEGLPM